jgi:thiamine-monophosphate kinase
LKNEFDIIEHYFNSSRFNHKHPEDKYLTSHDDIIKAIGDDCAIVKPDVKKLLVLSTDTLIEGVHFPSQTTAKDIAAKALAVNLSDLAAMGAKPAWFTLAITLPENITHHWLNNFSQQLHTMAEKYAIALVGGDTTRGKQLSITIQVHGYIEQQPMLRANAKVGDVIILSGEIGAAALGLKLAMDDPSIDLLTLSTKDKRQALDALNKPVPEIEKGRLISQYSQCAIDISDGLLADLGHILEQSQCAAKLDVDCIPLASCLKSIEQNKALLMALTGGDDYKLCVTLSELSWNKLKDDMGGEINTGFYPIGRIIEGQGITLLDKQHNVITELDSVNLENSSKGYNHFG